MAALSGPIAHRDEQLREVALYEPGQTVFQITDLPGQLLDALGQQAHGDASGLHHGTAAVTVATAEPCAGAHPCGILQPGQFLAQDRVGGYQDGLELVDRLGASLAGGVLGEFEHPGDLRRTVAGLGPSLRATAEHDPSSGLGQRAYPAWAHRQL
ncbi:hypothetical protein [Streptomyces sp. C10]|uniref:hypothetical protein n=1 Tax=Streptomyces sp. C10 TaxID=531941 RepID=UPI003980FE08